jgi:hypothetical protein
MTARAHTARTRSEGWFGCKSWIERTFIRTKAAYNTTQTSISCASIDPAFNATTDPCCSYE